MNINPEIKEVLQRNNIPTNMGLTVLLSIYFDCYDNSMNSPTMYSKLEIAGIVKWDNKGVPTWGIPLFEQQEVAFDWVAEWVELFADKNKARKGSVKDATTRMKKFFAQNPDIRKEEVIQATIMYLRSIDRPYVTTSHYFISKGVGADKTSGLYEWVERLREENKNSNEVRNNGSIYNTMQ